MKSKWYHEVGKHTFIFMILVCFFFPLYMMLNISLKTNPQFYANPWTPQAPFEFANWLRGWLTVKDYIANSVFVGVLSVSGSLTLAILGAFFFGRYEMPGKNILWSMFLVLLLMPAIANLVPLFMQLKHLGLLNSLWALIAVAIASSQVMGIFMLRGFIEEIPQDLFDAADVDGAGVIRQILNVVIPMSGSIISVVAILQFLSVWNNFVLPMIVIRDDAQLTIPVGLIRLDGEYIKQWGNMMAGYSISAIPLVLLFLFTMRLFVKGLTAGAIKG